MGRRRSGARRHRRRRAHDRRWPARPARRRRSPVGPARRRRRHGGDNVDMKALAIDGGGIRGLIPALVLAEIERRTGRAMTTMVDVIAGTSTGGIIACGLARPEPMSAEEIAAIYEVDGPSIFDRSAVKIITSANGYLDERYDDDGLVASLQRHLGTTRLSEATTRVLITAYDLQARQA